MKNLLSIPFLEEGNMFLLGKKKIHNLHFHPQSFYAFVWSECEKQKPFLLWGSDIGAKLLSAQLWWDGGQRYIFWVPFGPCFYRPTTTKGGGGVSEKSSPNSVVPVLRGLRRNLLCWPRIPGGPGKLDRVQRWPRGGQRSRGVSCRS